MLLLAPGRRGIDGSRVSGSVEVCDAKYNHKNYGLLLQGRGAAPACRSRRGEACLARFSSYRPNNILLDLQTSTIRLSGPRVSATYDPTSGVETGVPNWSALIVGISPLMAITAPLSGSEKVELIVTAMPPFGAIAMR